MKNLLEIANKLREGFEKAEVRLTNEDKDRINNDILNLSEPDFDKFVHELLKDCDNLCSGFYKRVSNLQFYIGFGSQSKSVVSKIWIHAYQKIDSDATKRNFLNEILNKDTRYFWNFISSLPGFCSKIELSASFAAKWFHRLAERIKNDLAGSEVYDGIESYVLAFPSSALEIFNIYESQLSNEVVREITAHILGLLRCSKKETVQAIDDRLKSSDDVDKRVCYYSSIFASYKNGAITLDQIPALLDQMLSDGSELVKDIAFWTVERGLIQDEDDFNEFGITWYQEHSSANISETSKYHIISSMWHLSYRNEKKRIDYLVTNRIISKILPVSNECLGTLDKLEYYLCDRMKNVSEFEDTIYDFVEFGIENLFCLFKHDKFEYFRSELSKLDLTHLITELVFSGDITKCRLGVLFLEGSEFTPLTSKTLPNINDENKNTALTELIRNRHINQTIAKKVQYFEPFFRNTNEELKEAFINEIYVQAINFPGNCLKEMKRFGRSKLIRTIISKTEKYFDNFQQIQKSPANGFSFPGYKEACLQVNKRWISKVKRSAEEKSVFLKFVSRVELVYGKDFSFFMGQNVSDASSMTQIENTMELPRLELIDPEGMTIKRLKTY